MIESPVCVPDDPLERYWRTARVRHRVWSDRLNNAGRTLSPSDAQRRDWASIAATIEEVFVSELLGRVWTGVLIAADRRKGIRHAEPVARSVLLSQLEVRRAALQLMVSSADVPLEELAKTDRLRRTTERWTDLLLGHLVLEYDLGEFAFEERRARDFAETSRAAEVTGPFWQFVLAGLRLAFSKRRLMRQVESDLQLEILRTIVACFPLDAFDQTGVFQSLKFLRIGRSGSLPESPPRHFMAGSRRNDQSVSEAARSPQIPQRNGFVGRNQAED